MEPVSWAAMLSSAIGAMSAPPAAPGMADGRSDNSGWTVSTGSSSASAGGNGGWMVYAVLALAAIVILRK